MVKNIMLDVLCMDAKMIENELRCVRVASKCPYMERATYICYYHTERGYPNDGTDKRKGREERTQNRDYKR